jgi:hypothetical protein
VFQWLCAALETAGGEAVPGGEGEVDEDAEEPGGEEEGS